MLCPKRVCAVLKEHYKDDPRITEMHASYKWCEKTKSWMIRERNDHTNAFMDSVTSINLDRKDVAASTLSTIEKGTERV